LLALLLREHSLSEIQPFFQVCDSIFTVFEALKPLLEHP
jgi:hypothetical protein